jgi:hypothetical protein
MTLRRLFIGGVFGVLGCWTAEAAETSSAARAAPLPIPGRGVKIDYLGDDFEADGWSFVHNLPKSSREEDGRSRGPTGFSLNRRWQEGPERGQPDVLEVIDAPPGGLPGSGRALLLKTQHSGVPGTFSHGMHQDDLICGITTRLGTTLQAAETPSCVVRVFLPEPSDWENRTGPHFGIRLGVRTTVLERNTGFLASGRSAVVEPYWPGMWIHFRSETSRGIETDSAHIKVRGDSRGIDFPVREIPAAEFGWWTFGMSISADGQIHYFASPGVDELTAADHLTSQFPYGFRAERLNSFFFNVCNRDDGQTWSTPFVIDDPSVYVTNAERVERLVDRRDRRRPVRSASGSNRR